MIALTNAEIAELRNIRNNSPVWPGDTLSHATAKSLAKYGLIDRTDSGSWVYPRGGRVLVLAAGKQEVCRCTQRPTGGRVRFAADIATCGKLDVALTVALGLSSLERYIVVGLGLHTPQVIC